MSTVTDWLDGRNVRRGGDVAVALRPGVGIAVAVDGASTVVAVDQPVTEVVAVERELAPRWIWWDRTTSDQLVPHDLAIARSWDVLTLHRLLHGGWRTSVAHVWARLLGL